MHFLFLLVSTSVKQAFVLRTGALKAKKKAGVMDGVSPKRWRDLCCPCTNCSHPAYASLKSIFRRDFHLGQSKWGFLSAKLD